MKTSSLTHKFFHATAIYFCCSLMTLSHNTLSQPDTSGSDITHTVSNSTEKMYPLALNTVQAPHRQGSGTDVQITWSAKEKSGSEYVQYLQMLYMNENPSEALVIHINSLLDFYAYADSRVKASNRMKNAMRHNLRINQRGEIITTTIPVPAKKEKPVYEDRFPVYGINPYVNTYCSQQTSSCWIKHPITSENWIQIVQNQEGLKELTKAMTQLIKVMQKK